MSLSTILKMLQYMNEAVRQFGLAQIASFTGTYHRSEGREADADRLMAQVEEARKACIASANRVFEIQKEAGQEGDHPIGQIARMAAEFCGDNVS